jgi:hypothetical protein
MRKICLLETCLGAVNGISFDLHPRNDLAEHFSKFGKIESGDIVTDHHSGRSKGYAIIRMESASAAKEATSILI